MVEPVGGSLFALLGLGHDGHLPFELCWGSNRCFVLLT
jgi:hypothetical protein